MTFWRAIVKSSVVATTDALCAREEEHEKLECHKSHLSSPCTFATTDDFYDIKVTTHGILQYAPLEHCCAHGQRTLKFLS